MENQEKKEQPIQALFKPDTLFTLDLQQMAILQRILQPFHDAFNILQDAKNAAAANGTIVDTYRDDYQFDENGNPVLINGQPQLKKDFWDKYLPKKEKKASMIGEEVK